MRNGTIVSLLPAQNSEPLFTQNRYLLRTRRGKIPGTVGPHWPGVCLIECALPMVRLRTSTTGLMSELNWFLGVRLKQCPGQK